MAGARLVPAEKIASPNTPASASSRSASAGLKPAPVPSALFWPGPDSFSPDMFFPVVFSRICFSRLVFSRLVFY